MKIGDKIFAVRNHSQGFFNIGDEFTLLNIRRCVCNRHFIFDVGIKIGPHNGYCQYSQKSLYSGNTIWFHADNFIETDNINIEQLKQILYECN